MWVCAAVSTLPLETALLSTGHPAFPTPTIAPHPTPLPLGTPGKGLGLGPGQLWEPICLSLGFPQSRVLKAVVYLERGFRELGEGNRKSQDKEVLSNWPPGQIPGERTCWCIWSTSQNHPPEGWVTGAFMCQSLPPSHGSWVPGTAYLRGRGGPADVPHQGLGELHWEARGIPSWKKAHVQTKESWLM